MKPEASAGAVQPERAGDAREAQALEALQREYADRQATTVSTKLELLCGKLPLVGGMMRSGREGSEEKTLEYDLIAMEALYAHLMRRAPPKIGATAAREAARSRADS